MRFWQKGFLKNWYQTPFITFWFIGYMDQKIYVMYWESLLTSPVTEGGWYENCGYILKAGRMGSGHVPWYKVLILSTWGSDNIICRVARLLWDMLLHILRAKQICGEGKIQKTFLARYLTARLTDTCSHCNTVTTGILGGHTEVLGHHTGVLGE